MTACHGDVWIADLDKVRPVVILTRTMAIPRLTHVAVAPITSAMRAVSTEVPIGTDEGLDHDSVISCDNIVTIPQSGLKHRVGRLSAGRREQLHVAIRIALDMD